MKKLIGFTLAFLMTFTFTACSGGATSEPASTAPESIEPVVSSDAEESIEATETTATGDLTIGVVVKYQYEFFTHIFDGAKKAGEEIGAEVLTAAPNSPSDVLGQVQLVEDMVAKDVDILIVVPIQPDTLTNALESAEEKGTIVIAADTDFNFPGKLCYVGTGNENAGAQVAEALYPSLPENANIVIMRGPLGSVSFDDRAAGVEKKMEELGVNVLEIVDAESVADKAAAKTEDLIQRYGDELHAIMCLDDQMTVGCVTAIKQAGKTEDIIVTGFDAFSAALEMVKTGEVLLDCAQNPFEMGYQSVMAGVDALNGVEVPEIIDTGVTMIDIENVDEFL
ncbi:sugar ABC transporter substrate-binding protein [Ruminococcaceae bacterium OttesenSCG-928-I18]|nr:sugar ABC transporter substrate-binding protein [Ruminococcaceae bacterium OttesenSCG-928-I18]